MLGNNLLLYRLFIFIWTVFKNGAVLDLMKLRPSHFMHPAAPPPLLPQFRANNYEPSKLFKCVTYFLNVWELLSLKVKKCNNAINQ